MAETRHYAERVNILKKIRIGNQWRFKPVALHNGRLVRDHVLVAGREEHHPEGSYYIDWYQDGKRKRKAVPESADVVHAARVKSIELNARKAGILPAAPEEAKARRLETGAAIDDYLDFIHTHRKRRTYFAYRYTLDGMLRQSYRKRTVEEVTREDIFQFMTDCYKKGLGKRTVYGKLVVVLQFFKRYGKSRLLEPGDWPDYVETIRPIYEAEEIEAMLKAASDREQTLLKFLLCSGFRDQEVRTVMWRDIDFRNHVARVTAKPQWRFTPKNWEERAVPLPDGLIEGLRRLKTETFSTPAQLVFPNKRGKPDSELDTLIKKIAERAKLNCGLCVTKHGNRCAAGPYCRNYYLHKFRHTFATEHLRGGIDIRTLQTWMGHRDIQSTMVYLKGVQSKDVLAKVNAGALAAYAG